MNSPLAKTLLLVEDDPALALCLRRIAQESGYEVRTCSAATEALNVAAEFKPTLVFSDVHLTAGDGRRVLAGLRADATMCDCQFVLMTGDWVGASRQASVEFEADDYLAKPFSIDEFVTCVNERYQQANR